MLLGNEDKYENFNRLIKKDESNEEKKTPKPFVIENLKDLWRIFGEIHFKYLIYNTAIGNQIIIRTDEIEIASSIIKVLKVLIFIYI